MRFLTTILTASLLLSLPSAARAASGRLQIRMETGELLMVFVDGEVVGETPLDRRMTPGTYLVEVRATETSARAIRCETTIESRATTELVGDWRGGTLGRDPGTATVRITVSGPDRYAVKVDDDPAEGTNTISVTPGHRTITVVARGWAPSSRAIDIQRDETRELQFDLQVADIGVEVHGTPADAHVLLIPAEKGDPIVLESMDGTASGAAPPGRYELVVESTSTSPYSEWLQLEFGDGEVQLTPELESTLAELSLEGLPSGAQVTITHSGGTETAVVEEREARFAVPQGRITCTVRAEGRETWTDAIELGAREERQVVARLRLSEDRRIRRITTARTAALGGATGVLTVVGLVLAGQANAQYQLASSHNDAYMSATDPDEVVGARESRDSAFETSRSRQTGGIVVMGMAAGAGVAALVSALAGKKRITSVRVSACVGPETAGVGLSWQW